MTAYDFPGGLVREMYLGHHRVGPRWTPRRLLSSYKVRVSSDDLAHVMVIAPQQTGKTSAYFTPLVLSTSRAVIATGTKVADILLTIPHRVRVARRTGGKVYLLNLGREPLPTQLPDDVIDCRHDPLAGCEDTTHCQKKIETYLTLRYGSSGRSGPSDNAAFFQGRGGTILQAYFHAAALEKLGIRQVLQWVATRASDEPCSIIRRHGAAPDWAAELEAVKRSAAQVTSEGAFQTASDILKPFRDPAVQRLLVEPNFDAKRFLEEGVSTVYILDTVGQKEMSPICSVNTAFSEDVVHHARRKASTVPMGRWEPGLLLAADEAANVMPLPGLPAICSQGASRSITVAFALQSSAQLDDRYGRQVARTIRSNTPYHVIFGRVGVGDREYLEDVCASVPPYFEEEVSHSTGVGGRRSTTRRVVRRPTLTVSDIASTPRGQAMLVSHHKPCLLDMPPWEQVPWARRRGWMPGEPIPADLVEEVGLASPARIEAVA